MLQNWPPSEAFFTYMAQLVANRTEDFRAILRTSSCRGAQNTPCCANPIPLRRVVPEWRARQNRAKVTFYLPSLGTAQGLCSAPQAPRGTPRPLSRSLFVGSTRRGHARRGVGAHRCSQPYPFTTSTSEARRSRFSPRLEARASARVAPPPR